MNLSFLKSVSTLIKTSKAAIVLTLILVLSFVSTSIYILFKTHPLLETPTSGAKNLAIGMLVLAFLVMVAYETYSRFRKKTKAE
ncbi:hypothetical protein HYG86_10870 [Alkalicella caledoniensis]|uniref:Uncharacterized protein n=1 Tax=Alkalicella caledoniensis TaxID=2731377 RepID=A0A7G9W966_ALKCA|nr:hypothetical protein [Alkalicella caledoniensis]QNO15228.1 hypothetical protein HYG86_10870 [Alkalicella caledoniensis]